MAKPEGIGDLVKHTQWQPHLAHNAALAALQRLDIGDAAVDVDRGWRQGEDFGDATSTPQKREAKDARLGLGAPCGSAKRRRSAALRALQLPGGP